MTSQTRMDNDRHLHSHLRSSPSQIHHRAGNVFHLLARREVSHRTKCCPKRQWGKAPKHIFVPGAKGEAIRDAKSGLSSWVEAESMGHLSGEYCSLTPSPRSTIAAAFSSDGKRLASTHGDHTVKIIECLSGRCLKVFSGHRRTPWVVRFHPRHPAILASGSLDHEVRLWNADTSECIGSRIFYRPIASIAFHAEGHILAVASGHKLYLWHYNQKEEGSTPSVILKTRRSLRAIHFHPQSAGLLLTAEVNDLDASDSSVAKATSLGRLHYPPPTVYMANVNSSDCHSLAAELPLMPLPFPCPISTGPSSSIQFHVDANLIEESFTEMSPDIQPTEEDNNNNNNNNNNNTSSDQETSSEHDNLPLVQNTNVHLSYPSRNSGMHVSATTLNSLLEEQDLPEASIPNNSSGSGDDNSLGNGLVSISEEEANPVLYNSAQEGVNSTPIINRIETELSVSLAATAAAELPCTVKLRIWQHDTEQPCAPLTAERCRLTIPHAVLCSEMGTHFSPCGKYLAACVACVLPETESDLGMVSDGTPTSPTRHPISARQIIYELRIYSLEEPTFGEVLVSRAIRAAHCLTSIQFSPTSGHILLAYGRRHCSLLKSIVINGEASVPIYTVLEVYRVCDLELVSVLPSAEDEVNVASFHPLAGGGLVYGTKEGKLRVLQCDRSRCNDNIRPNLPTETKILEIPAYALEC